MEKKQAFGCLFVAATHEVVAVSMHGICCTLVGLPLVPKYVYQMVMNPGQKFQIW